MTFTAFRRRTVALALVPLLLVVAACDTRAVTPQEGPVVVYGDSLAWEARSYLSFLGANNGQQVKVKAVGGLAACDWVASIRADLAAPVKPKMIVLEFWGNNLTSCMGAVGDKPGYPIGSSAYFARYRSALDQIAASARNAGVPVFWASSPPRHYSDVKPDLNEVFEGMARRRGWTVMPTGDAVASPDGRWVRRLPCNDWDVDSDNCKSGVAEVRSPDHVHFSKGTDGQSPGAVRWAGAVIGEVLEASD